MTTDQAKKNNKSNVRFMKIAMVVLFVAVIIASAIYILYKVQPGIFGDKTDNNSTNAKIKLGTGGDVQYVANYNDQAIKLWKSGNKKKAQEAAKKGFEEAKKLTPEQIKQLPDPIEVTYNLQMMSEGRGPSQ